MFTASARIRRGEVYTIRFKKSVDEARAEGADYVVLVAHLGKEGITERWSSRSVIANTTGIDVLIDGHSHQTYAETMTNENGEEIPVAQTGTKFANIGKLPLLLPVRSIRSW